MTLWEWLHEQRGRNDPVGDLARKVTADRGFPRKAMDLQECVRHLMRRRASGEAIVAMHRAWWEWAALPKLGRGLVDEWRARRETYRRAAATAEVCAQCGHEIPRRDPVWLHRASWPGGPAASPPRPRVLPVCRSCAPTEWQEPSADARVHDCEACGRPVLHTHPTAGVGRVYCCRRCQSQVASQRQRARAAGASETSPSGRRKAVGRPESRSGARGATGTGPHGAPTREKP
jgi:uncharacterized protein YozE (UPF0346 family)